MKRVNAILSEVKKAVSGKDNLLLWILTCMLAGGHVLLEDIPGVGKTTAALAFSRAMDLTSGRVQFNPDVLPSDITGYSIYDKESGTMRYQPGAVLCNLFLADELNRATSRTQSALLEAMEEGRVTVDGVTHAIPEPFIVFATQNPTGAAGTQLLPDSQLDRFTMRLSVGYPSAEAEKDMLVKRFDGDPLGRVRRVISREEFLDMREQVRGVYVKDELAEYMVSLMSATRSEPMLSRGGSPRATLSLMSVSKAVAFVQGRDYVVPKDVSLSFERVTAHRVQLSAAGRTAGISPEKALRAILSAVAAPKV